MGLSEVLISPLMTAELLSPTIPVRKFSSLIFTSETGVAATINLAARASLPRRAYCVGPRTASAAQAAGFDVTAAEGDSAALTRLILALRPDAPLLFMRGEESVGEIDRSLNLAGIETVSAIVYRQASQPLSEAAAQLLRSEGAVILPIFSPRSAELMVAEAKRIAATAPLHVAALSRAVAEAAAPLQGAALQIAARPDSPAMAKAVAALIRRLCAT